MLHDHAVSVMETHGAVVTPIDLNALDLPLYSPELDEKAFPETAQMFKNQLMEAGTSIMNYPGSIALKF